MAAIGRSVRSGTELTTGERAALAERQAWGEAKARNHKGAADLLQTVINDPSIHHVQRAELIFRAAGYLYRVDPAGAAAFYQKAFHINSSLPRPTEVTDKRYSRIREQAAKLREYLEVFTGTNAALAKLEEIRATLAYSGDAETVESGLQQLGEMLGASSSRPEKETGRGPDVLWLFQTRGFCIEGKSEKHRPIFKKDAEQLLLSLQWCARNTDVEPGSIVGVFATDVIEADRFEDISYGPLFLPESTLFELIERLRTVLTSLSYDGPLFNDTRLIDKALRDSRLLGEDLTNALPKAKGKGVR